MRVPTEELTIGDLIPDPDNARRHSERGVGIIEAALGEVGAARSIVIDEDNTILAGNATIEAAGNRGLEKVRVIETNGDEIIAVRRRNLTPEQKKKLAYYDNRGGEFSDWDPERVLFDTEEMGIDLSDMFTETDLTLLLEQQLKEAEKEEAALRREARAEVEMEEDETATAPRIDTGDHPKNPVLTYEFAFDNSAQKQAFLNFLRSLRRLYPDLDTPGKRLEAFIKQISE
jgi:hypothetical protein